MRSPIIGIISACKIHTDDDPFNDQYITVNNYVKKIYEYGGTPISIVFDDEKMIKESLDLCDGIVFQGGIRIRPVFFDVIDYCMNKNIPILGICLGMQAIALFSVNKERHLEKDDYKTILKKIETNINHWPMDVTRENIDTLVHDIIIDKDSLLHDILDCDTIRVNSLHKYSVTSLGSNFKVSARSKDGVIEAIELDDPNNFVLGVGWHPEIINNTDNIFKYFIDKCTKRES